MLLLAQVVKLKIGVGSTKCWYFTQRIIIQQCSHSNTSPIDRVFIPNFNLHYYFVDSVRTTLSWQGFDLCRQTQRSVSPRAKIIKGSGSHTLFIDNFSM